MADAASPTSGGGTPRAPSPRKGPPARLAARLALALATLLVAAGLAEVTLRLVRPAWPGASFAAGGPEDLQLGRARRLSRDPRLYYELVPGATLAFGGSTVRIDEAGRRVPVTDSAPPPPGLPSPIRLAVVGDSSAFGWGVMFEESYPALVARRLQALWKRPVEVVNWSVPGYNSEQEQRLFETRILADDPDLVLWHYDHNDATAILPFGEPVGLPPEVGTNALGSEALAYLLRRLEQFRLAPWLHETVRHPRFSGYVTSGPLYDRHLAALQRAAATAAARRLPVLLVVFDPQADRPGPVADAHFETLHARLVPRLRAFGFEVFDTYPAEQALLVERGWRDLSAFQLDPASDIHPNREGHAWLAEVVAPELARLRVPALRQD